MGGRGSGRHWHYGTHDTTDDRWAIDVRRWNRDGLLTPHQSFGWQWLRHGDVAASIGVRTEPGRIILSYSHRSGGEDWKDESYPVYPDWTACHLGGQRAWFLCPGEGCGRRVAILYLGGAGIFACRHCGTLAYACQREPSDDRAARRADRIRRKLGWPVGIFNPDGGKPSRMHLRTFHRLKSEHDEFVRASLGGTAKRLGLLQDRRGRAGGNLSEDG